MPITHSITLDILVLKCIVKCFTNIQHSIFFWCAQKRFEMLLECLIERNFHISEAVHHGTVFNNDFRYEADELIEIISICEDSEELG